MTGFGQNIFICSDCGNMFRSRKPHARLCGACADFAAKKAEYERQMKLYEEDEARRSRIADRLRRQYVPIPFAFHVKRFDSWSTGIKHYVDKVTRIRTRCAHCGKVFEYDTEAPMSWHIIRAFCSSACEYDWCYRTASGKNRIKHVDIPLIDIIPPAREKPRPGQEEIQNPAAFQSAEPDPERELLLEEGRRLGLFA